MSICELFGKGRRTLSFEVFPPVREGNLEKLFTAIGEIRKLKPDFISVTYGAGGGTRDMTLEIASTVKNRFKQEVLAHLTCVGSKKEDIARILDDFKREGIENIMALRGDPPRGETRFQRTEGGFGYANELVDFIRQRDDFCIGVAGYPEGHPEAPSLEEDLKNLKRKVSAGADFIITQLFFDNQDFYRFRDKAAAIGISVPIIPGIFPLLSFKQIPRIVSLGGASIPAALEGRLRDLEDSPEDSEKFGIDYAIGQCRDLLENGVPGLHICCMNRSRTAIEITNAVGDFRSRGL
ncbi:MAG: methylenetetrahydrofolate reductase [NAD(P)H] [Syntrophaceae bacterium]